jgi:hypothetical protein
MTTTKFSLITSFCDAKKISEEWPGLRIPMLFLSRTVTLGMQRLHYCETEDTKTNMQELNNISRILHISLLRC